MIIRTTEKIRVDIAKSARIHDVGMCDRRCLGNLVDADFVASGKDRLDYLVCPVGTVAKQAKVAKRLLWAAQLSFTLAKEVRKLNHESPITVSLMLR